MKLLESVFQNDFEQIKTSTILVFSKVKTKDWNLDDIKKNVEQIIDSNKNFTVKALNFLKVILQKDNICIFPTPDDQKIANYIQVLKNKILGLKEINLTNNAKLSLSPQAIYLKNQFQAYLAQKSWTINSEYKNILINKYSTQKFNHSSNVDAYLNQAKNIQNSTINMYNSANNQSLWENYLNNFQNMLQVPKQTSDQAIHHMKMIKFCRKLNQKFNEYQKFVQILKLNMIQTIQKLDQQKSRLYNAEQKVIQQEIYRQQKIKKDLQNQKLKKELQAKLQNQKKQRQYYGNLIIQQAKRQYEYSLNRK